ncbi:MAG: Uma2 family endonuclease [Snowella sp.]|nr:Uma2 family endonuclease [Snowella sp.]
MIMPAQTKITYTPEEYLAIEISSETRHEYINGEIIPMTGGTPEHNEIASILNAILRTNLKGKPYSIFIADQRLWIPEKKLYTYPDVMIAQRPIQLQIGRKDTVINPIFIAEVLSQSTKNYDKDEKFSAYRTIPSFQEYLLIDQSSQHIEHYSKSGFNQWIFSEYNNSEDYINLTSISCKISLLEVYDDIEFKTN